MTKAYITIDMETPQTPYMNGLISHPFFYEQYEFGAILDICYAYEIPATFFLNVYGV